jgi:hypothetical protein
MIGELSNAVELQLLFLGHTLPNQKIIRKNDNWKRKKNGPSMLVASGKSLKNQAPQEWSATSQNCALPCSATFSNVSTDAWGE